MGLVQELLKEFDNRADCVQADYERLIASGANDEALQRIIKHSIEIGAIKDKLHNIRIHDLLEEKNENISKKRKSGNKAGAVSARQNRIHENRCSSTQWLERHRNEPGWVNNLDTTIIK